jgi:hypothetical protein
LYALDKGRASIEQGIGRLKRFKRIALRCEKTAQNFAAFISLACTSIRAKSVHTASVSVRDHFLSLSRLLAMRRMEASRIQVRLLRLRHSQSLASRRHRPSQAKVRSTTPRLGRTTKPCA